MPISHLALLLALAGTAPSAPVPAPTEWTVPKPDETRLITYPRQTYFTTANAKEGIAASILFVLVDAPAGATVEPVALAIDYLQGGTAVRQDRWSTAMLAPVTATGIPSSRVYPASLATARQLSHGFRLMLEGPAALPFDAVRFTLEAKVDGAPRTLALSIRATRYEQKTPLIFPFRGPGTISVAGVLAAGHRNRSGMYAIDAMGLNETYGPMRTGADTTDPANYAGWGREIIAPAAGRVVFVRNDHVDQPATETSNPAYFLPQYKNGGDPGNYVVIDHGNGEFSMIAHMQRNSVRVAVGDTVSAGQLLGLMGNSGDTTGPHVHYQLQNGPDWENADALPFVFTNVESIARGSYFNAKAP